MLNRIESSLFYVLHPPSQVSSQHLPVNFTPPATQSPTFSTPIQPVNPTPPAQVPSNVPVSPNGNSNPLPLTHHYMNEALPSSAIDVNSLVSIEEALESLMTKKGSKQPVPSTVTQGLAKLAIFGVNTMKQCTPSGSNAFPALPKNEMFQLKKAVFHASPRFWHSPTSFEVEWKSKCWPAIEQACRRLRRAQH